MIGVYKWASLQISLEDQLSIRVFFIDWLVDFTQNARGWWGRTMDNLPITVATFLNSLDDNDSDTIGRLIKCE